jgi:hypothetical protein
MKALSMKLGRQIKDLIKFNAATGLNYCIITNGGIIGSGQF